MPSMATVIINSTRVKPAEFPFTEISPAKRAAEATLNNLKTTDDSQPRSGSRFSSGITPSTAVGSRGTLHGATTTVSSKGQPTLNHCSTRISSIPRIRGSSAAGWRIGSTNSATDSYITFPTIRMAGRNGNNIVDSITCISAKNARRGINANRLSQQRAASRIRNNVTVRKRSTRIISSHYTGRKSRSDHQRKKILFHTVSPNPTRN